MFYQLYLPSEWTDDRPRCIRAGVPESIGFMSKNQIAAAQIRAAVAAGVPRGVVLGDAAYGDDCGLRDALSEQGLTYALGIRPHTAVWWGEHQPVAVAPSAAKERPRVRVVTAHENQARPAEWLVIEWPRGEEEPTRHWLFAPPEPPKLPRPSRQPFAHQLCGPGGEGSASVMPTLRET